MSSIRTSRCRTRRSSRTAEAAAAASTPARPAPSSSPTKSTPAFAFLYLTIELFRAILIELRPAIGNRIYGCDDCQLLNSFARSGDPDFAVRNGLDTISLVELFGSTEAGFLERLAGSPIRRIGHERWLRNIAVALENGAPMPRRLLRWNRAPTTNHRSSENTSSGPLRNERALRFHETAGISSAR